MFVHIDARLGAMTTIFSTILLIFFIVYVGKFLCTTSSVHITLSISQYFFTLNLDPQMNVLCDKDNVQMFMYE